MKPTGWLPVPNFSRSSGANERWWRKRKMFALIVSADTSHCRLWLKTGLQIVPMPCSSSFAVAWCRKSFSREKWTTPISAFHRRPRLCSWTSNARDRFPPFMWCSLGHGSSKTLSWMPDSERFCSDRHRQPQYPFTWKRGLSTWPQRTAPQSSFRNLPWKRSGSRQSSRWFRHFVAGWGPRLPSVRRFRGTSY